MSYTSSLQLLLLELGRHQVLPLWLDLQPVDIESRWRHNWKSAQVVNSHLQAGNRVSTSLGNSGLCWTVFVQNGEPFSYKTDTAVPAEGNGDLQTLICVLVARPRRCLTLSNPVPTKLNAGLSRLHSADEDAVSWLTSYGSWNAYEKKKVLQCLMIDYSWDASGIDIEYDTNTFTRQLIFYISDV